MITVLSLHNVCSERNKFKKLRKFCLNFAGKAVFCEKPLAISEEGIERCLDAVKKSKKPLLTAFNRYLLCFTECFFLNYYQVKDMLLSTNMQRFTQFFHVFLRWKSFCFSLLTSRDLINSFLNLLTHASCFKGQVKCLTFTFFLKYLSRKIS